MIYAVELECKLEYFLSGAQQVDAVLLQGNEDSALRGTVLIYRHSGSIENAHEVALLQSANPYAAGLCGDLYLMFLVLNRLHRQSCGIVQF